MRPLTELSLSKGGAGNEKTDDLVTPAGVLINEYTNPGEENTLRTAGGYVWNFNRDLSNTMKLADIFINGIEALNIDVCICLS